MKLLILLLVLGLIILNFSVRNNSPVRKIVPPMLNESSLVPLPLQHQVSPAKPPRKPLFVSPEVSPVEGSTPSNITYTEPHPDNDPEEEEEKRKFQYDDYSNLYDNSLGEGGENEKADQ